jgi:hypothetical protein
MADDNNPRSYRSSEPYPRASFKGASGNDPLAELARLIGQTDPFAEFGRQQQSGISAAVAPQGGEQAWPAHGYSALPVAPEQNYDGYSQQAAAETLHDGYHSANHDAAQHGASGYDTNAYYRDEASSQGQDVYDDVPPRGRRFSVIAIAAVLALGIVGTAGAFGYRALFGTSGSSPPPVIKADTAPTKVVPPSKSEPQSNKLIYDRVGDRASNEKIVSREEQPIDLSKTQPSNAPSGSSSSGSSNASSAVGVAAASPSSNALADASPSPDQPKKVHTIVIRPDQPQGTADPAPPPARVASAAPPKPAPAPKPQAPPAPQRLASAPPVSTVDAEPAMPVARAPVPAPARTAAAAPSRNAPLSLSPDATPSAPPAARAEPTRTASAPARIAPAATTGAAGAYAVQLSSQRSEADAQAAFQSLQAKYPSQLSGRQPIIRRADLGAKGIYYRAMVGPFASSADASGFCQSLKTAGGSCLIQKN